MAIALQECAIRASVPRAAIDDELRDRVVGLLAGSLLGVEAEVQLRSLAGRLSAPFTDVLSRAGTVYMQLSRDDVFASATPVAGDIVLYQARMEPFHDFIRKAIEHAPRPLVLLTHSLGGVMSFDMLALAAKNGNPLGVNLLITTALRRRLSTAGCLARSPADRSTAERLPGVAEHLRRARLPQL